MWGTDHGFAGGVPSRQLGSSCIATDGLTVFVDGASGYFAYTIVVCDELSGCLSGSGGSGRSVVISMASGFIFSE